MTVPLDVDERALLQGNVLMDPRRIHVLDARQEHSGWRPDVTRDVHCLLCQLFDIRGQRARIDTQVFMRCKLGGIDKDGDDGQVVFMERSANCVRCVSTWGVGHGCERVADRERGGRRARRPSWVQNRPISFGQKRFASMLYMLQWKLESGWGTLGVSRRTLWTYETLASFAKWAEALGQSYMHGR